MTTKEQQTIDSLFKAVQELRSENSKFREDVKLQIEAINTKTEKKHMPITFEHNILTAAQLAINESFTKVMTAYDSPIYRLVRLVVDENSTELKTIISDSFNQVIKTTEFKQSIVNAFAHKVARTIISNNESLFDKVSKELKQDTIFKSKMALAVSNVVEECLRK